MQGCLPARHRLRDLLFSVCGALAFLTDLGSDVWSTVRYYEAGDTAWAVLYFGLFVLSSIVLQLLSWGWFWVDWQDWKLQERALEAASGAVKHDASGSAAQTSGDDTFQASINVSGNGHTGHYNENGTKSPEDAGNVTNVDTAASVMDAKPLEVPDQYDPIVCLHEAATTSEDSSAEEELVIRRFCTSKIILWPSCFTLLHVLQLGYPLRCIHSLEVGLAAYRNPKDDLFKDYAYFVTHDISMMRLMETFLENTPQLILVLYIVIQREAIQTFQYFSISISFICISWAILDYHQSLRMFLKEKRKLSIFSSAVYYSWNFCLISSRILCITLFTVVFHWLIALHFLSIWLVFFSWAFLQKTTFMKLKYLEIVYRATVAVILYFSWFNIADRRTIYRSIFYHGFITFDSVILVVSWKIYKFPSSMDECETYIIVANIVFITVGLCLRLLYYHCLHPNVRSETKQYFDVPDGTNMFRSETKAYFDVPDGTNMALSKRKTRKMTNERMAYLLLQLS